MWLILTFVTFLQITSYQAAIPSYIKLCKRTDPHLDECITNDIQVLMPKLKDGIPELNAPSLEPLTLDTVKLRSGPNQAKINADISDLKLYGVSELQILSLKADIPNKVFTAKFKIPEIYFRGNYDMDINVLILKYQGKGQIAGNFTNYICELKFKYELFAKNDKEYMHFPKIELKLTQGTSLIDLEGLSQQSNTAFARGMYEVIRDNTDLFVKEIMPNLEHGLTVKITEIGNNITHNFPYDELFLP